jgi:ABC-type transport system involved in multi-copper enzyme maturation permease subunit
LAKELRENRVKFVIMVVILGILGISIPLLFDWTGNILRNLDLSPFINPGELSFIISDYGNYAWSQWTAKNLTQLATLAAIVLGMGALAGEAAYGTAPFLLSKPLSRRRVYTTKIIAGAILLAGIVFGSTVIFILVSGLKCFAFDRGAFLVSSALAFGGAVVIYLGTAIFSVLIAEPVRAGVAAALFWILASLPGYFKSTAAYSIFFQMKAVRYWLLGESPLVPLLLFLVTGWILFEMGVFLWSRKDF